jgi:ankyrin repeat protein
MNKKYFLTPIIVLIALCGGENADVTENNESVETTVSLSVEEPTIDLITAVIDDDLETVNQHIAYGSDLNVQDGTFSNTPLNFAGIYGLTDIANALIDAGADLNLINDDNFTPLCNAAAWGHTSVVTILLDAGADLSAKCFETQIGVSVSLSIAIGAPYSDYIKSLYVDHGEKYNIPYDETKIIEGREKVIELLRSR